MRVNFAYGETSTKITLEALGHADKKRIRALGKGLLYGGTPEISAILKDWLLDTVEQEQEQEKTLCA